MSGSDSEEFNCTNVDAIRVRFGPPGYVEDDRVGLYVDFEGIPKGAKRLRIWWNIENDPVTFQDFRFADDETDIEELYEHQYPGLTGPTEMVVRVELIRDQLTGNCARNRHIVVAPPVTSSGGSAPAGPIPPPKTTSNVGPSIAAVDTIGFGTDGLRFQAATALTIDSVWVDPSGAGNLIVTLEDPFGTVTYASKTVPVAAAGPQQITVGFNVPAGSYVLNLDTSGVAGASAGAINFSFFGGPGASYPFSIAGVISIDDSTNYFGACCGYYPYLFNWQVTW